MRKTYGRPLSYNGKTQPLSEWSKETGIPLSVLKQRRQRGYPPERMLEPLSPSQPDMLEWRGQWWRLKDLARRYGMSPTTLRRRLADGMPLDVALHMPPMRCRFLMVQWQGREVWLRDLAIAHHQSPGTVYRRLRAGWSLEAALEMDRVPRNKKPG